jgi:DNA-3-methyladenine glycosylase
MKLSRDFYLRKDVVEISKDLLGKYLFTRIDGKTTAGIITETEAYEGITDKASHAYGGRRTPRTETMYATGGIAYVYLCYGIHNLFNVVTNIADVPHAVLIRAVIPAEGIQTILQRRKKEKLSGMITSGPGTLSEALAIRKSHSGVDLTGKTIWLEDRNIRIPARSIVCSPRVGVDYAEEDAQLPYRFRANLRYEQPAC